MITFSNIRISTIPTKSGRTLIYTDINYNGNTYKWAMYVSLGENQTFADYLTIHADEYQQDIDDKEAYWLIIPHTEEIDDPDNPGQTITIDIPKDSVVKPDIPDYEESVFDTKADIESMKRLLQILTNTILNDPNITIPLEQRADLSRIYDYWKIGKSYNIDECVDFKGTPYKVIKSHISESTWTPDKSPNLFSDEIIKTTISVNTPKRLALPNETLPITEIITIKNSHTQVRYDFYETFEGTTRYFNFKYINVKKNTRNQIIKELIALKYDQEQENALQRKKLIGEDSLEFLKYNNYVKYCKAVADNQDLTAIKNEIVFEIIVPLELCAIGYDYGNMAFEAIIKNISFEVDAVSGTGRAYPSWLAEKDQIILNSDPRVTLTEIPLYIE